MYHEIVNLSPHINKMNFQLPPNFYSVEWLSRALLRIQICWISHIVTSSIFNFMNWLQSQWSTYARNLELGPFTLKPSEPGSRMARCWSIFLVAQDFEPTRTFQQMPECVRGKACSILKYYNSMPYLI